MPLLAHDLHDVFPGLSWFSPLGHGSHSVVRPIELLLVPNVQLKQNAVAE